MIASRRRGPDEMLSWPMQHWIEALVAVPTARLTRLTDYEATLLAQTRTRYVEHGTRIRFFPQQISTLRQISAKLGVSSEGVPLSDEENNRAAQPDRNGERMDPKFDAWLKELLADCARRPDRLTQFEKELVDRIRGKHERFGAAALLSAGQTRILLEIEEKIHAV